MTHNVRKPLTWVLLAVGGVALAALLAFVFGLIVMALWNWLMPGIFGLRAISYWEAWGIVLMAHILFKAGRWDRHSERRDRAGDPEWKERLRQRFKERFSRGEDAGEAQSTPNG
ncbi:MAG: hypothetical protein JW820_13985 [Spirochaetales bacterium]|nr:hypothetical protein [Spirochaetales bacterium]